MSQVEDVSKYKRLTEVQHVLARPGMYLGSTNNTEQLSWVVSGEKMVEETVKYNPGLLKLVDEIVLNSVDEHVRSGNVKNIWVNINPMMGEIIVEDDGGIPVQKHPEYGTFIPEMIFSEFRTGSNFSDDDRTTAGLNGLGSKLTSVFSKEFRVDTCDGKKRFVQVFRNNLSERGSAVIQPYNKNGTKISFIPDYERLGCTLDDDNIKKIKRRIHDIAGCNPKIKVHFDGVLIKINKFTEYVGMFTDSFVFDETDTFQVAVAATPDESFRQVSFVNGIDTHNGGTHVDYVANQICNRIREFVKKKHKVDVKPNTIKQQLFLFINCQINAPMFTSQTKEFMSTEVRDFGTTYTPSDKFIKKILESEVVQKVLDWVAGEKRREELAELRKLNKQTQNNNFLKRIVKFDDATSTDRSKCSCYFTEGDSAAKTILSARTSAIHGVFPLKGKLINVRGVEIKKLVANEEFQNIMSILGLKVGQKIESPDDLRFGKVVILSDQDPDGAHIAGLFFNMLNFFWPELFKMKLVYRMTTPLVVAEIKGKQFEFFNTKDYSEWAIQNPAHKKKYFKGLGGFMTKDFKRFLEKEETYLQRIGVDDLDDVAALDMAFDKSKADERKAWLTTK
jgi:DNA topoisomerase II